MYELSRVVKSLFHDIEYSANDKYNASQIFVISAFWSGTYKVLFSVLFLRGTWNVISV